MAHQSALPDGYMPHDGGKCPVNQTDYVDLVIRTIDGLGHSGVCRADFHEWDASKHKDGIGAVVGYRLAKHGEAEPIGHRRKRWPEFLPKA